MPNSNEILFGQVCTSLVYDKERFDLICAEPFFQEKGSACRVQNTHRWTKN